MNITSIEARLIEQADKDLKQQIENAFAPAYNLVSSQSAPIPMSTDDRSKANVRPFIAIAALQELAFILRCDSNRQEALNAFMAKVDNLTTQLEELQSQIQ